MKNEEKKKNSEHANKFGPDLILARPSENDDFRNFGFGTLKTVPKSP